MEQPPPLTQQEINQYSAGEYAQLGERLPVKRTAVSESFRDSALVYWRLWSSQPA